MKNITPIRKQWTDAAGLPVECYVYPLAGSLIAFDGNGHTAVNADTAGTKMRLPVIRDGRISYVDFFAHRFTSALTPGVQISAYVFIAHGVTPAEFIAYAARLKLNIRPR